MTAEGPMRATGTLVSLMLFWALPEQVEAQEPALAQDAAQPSLALNPVWDMPIWGTSIGRTGMVPVDLDGDGRLEIVMSAAAGGFSGTSSWRVVRYNPVTREYD